MLNKMRRRLSYVGAVMTIAALMALVAVRPIGASASRNPKGIEISHNVGHDFGPVVARIRKGSCTIKGPKRDRRFVMVGYSTDRRYHLTLGIWGLKGFGHRYEILHGTRRPASFNLLGPGQSLFSNTFTNPGEPDIPVGEVAFRKKGAVMSVTAVAPDEDDRSKGVRLTGEMACTY